MSTTPPGLGKKSYLQFGLETTWGTAVAATHKYELISDTFTPEQEEIQDPSLFNGRSPRATYQGRRLGRGSVKIRCNYEGWLPLIKLIQPSYTATVIETGVRDHIFKEGLPLTLPSATMQIIKGDIPTTKCFQLPGAKVATAVIEGAAKGMVTVELTMFAKDMISNVTPTPSLSFPGLFPVKYDQCGSVAGGTVDDGTADAAGLVRVRRFKYSHNNGLADDRDFMGSLNPDEFLDEDWLESLLELEQEFITRTQFDAIAAFTTGTPQLIFKHPTTIGVSSVREFEIRQSNATPKSISVPIPGPGKLISTFVWKGNYDPTDAGAAVIRVRSTEAALP